MPSLSFSTKQELGWHLHCLDRAERLVSQWYSGSTFYFNTESFFTIYLQKCFNSQRSSLIFPDSRLFQEWSFQSIFWTCHGKTGHYPREELAGEDCVFQCFFPLRYCYDCIFLPISTGGLSSSLKKKQTINHENVMYWHWQHCHAAVVSSNFCHLLSLLFHHCYSCQKTVKLDFVLLTCSENSITVIPAWLCLAWHVQKIPSLLFLSKDKVKLDFVLLTCSENSIIVIHAWLHLAWHVQKIPSLLFLSKDEVKLDFIFDRNNSDGKASLKQQKLFETTTDTEDVCKFYVWNVHISKYLAL